LDCFLMAAVSFRTTAAGYQPQASDPMPPAFETELTKAGVQVPSMGA
jgi:hypothetical protein